MNPRTTLLFLSAFFLVGDANASGVAFRLIIGAPPDPNYQEVAGDGNAALPPRGYSPGYGYPRDYMNMPSLVITNERHGPGIPEVFVPSPEETMGAMIRVRVPAEAQVWIGGNATAQRGSERLFQSPPLRDGVLLTYEVRARWQQDGKAVDRTRIVVVHPGDRITVDFQAPDAEGADTLPRPRRMGEP
jgi:uncharacterized protein (TIGR03000 family)